MGKKVNHMLISFEIAEIDMLIGIYPSYEEAAFIRSKVRFPNQCIISTTKAPITTDRVGDFLRKKRTLWRYSKKQGTTKSANGKK